MSSKASFVLIVFAIFIDLTVVPSHAVESHAESYWKAKLGNIPMPKALKYSLLLGSNDGSAKLNHNSMYQPEKVSFIGYGGGPPHSINQRDNTKFIPYGKGHQQRSTNQPESVSFIGYGGGAPHSINQRDNTKFIPYGKGHQQRSTNKPELVSFIGYGGGAPHSINQRDNTKSIPYGKGHQQRSTNQPELVSFIGYGVGAPHSINQRDNTKFIPYGKGHQQRSTNQPESVSFIGYSGGAPHSVNQRDNTKLIPYGKGHQQRSTNQPEGVTFIGYGGGAPHSINQRDNTKSIPDGKGHQQGSTNHPESTNIVNSSNGPVVFFTNEVLLGSPGAKMKLHFSEIDSKSKFLPLQIAKSMPTSSDKLQVILNLLSVNPKSIEAQDIENTIKECEKGGVTDEVRHCTTSLEAMIDYVTLNLSSAKNKLKVLSTEQDEEILMEYKIQKAEKLGDNDDNNHNLVCHKMSNPYAVFLCHNLKHTNVYGVSLIGANGRKTKAVAVCHMDTSSWNPDYIAFQLLKIKPGSKPICHFLSGNAIVWLPN